MNNLKLAICTLGVFPHSVGGIQRHTKLFVDELSTYENIQITVLHPDKSAFSGQNVSQILVPGIDSSKNYLLERYRYSKRIYCHLKSLDDHIIYSQGPSVWHRAGDFSSRLIINPHGLEPFQTISLKDNLIGFPFRMAYRWLFRQARYVVSLGGHLTEILRPLVKSPHQIVELPNAVSEPNIETLKVKKIQQPLRALFVGRFASNKGIHILMEAIDKLNARGYNNEIEFYLAGKGPLYEQYKKENNRENVHILGFVSDEKLISLYKKSDLFVLPTLFEGMPTVVLEAMSHALPIIVSDVGATAELVSDDNGFLIKKNDVQKLTDALIQFINLSHKQKKALGQKSLRKVQKRFTWPKVTKAHLQLFKKIAF